MPSAAATKLLTVEMVLGPSIAASMLSSPPFLLLGGHGGVFGRPGRHSPLDPDIDHRGHSWGRTSMKAVDYQVSIKSRIDPDTGDRDHTRGRTLL